MDRFMHNIQTHFILVLLVCLPVSALRAQEPGVTLNYGQELKEYYSIVLSSRPEFSPDTPLEPELSSVSPFGFATAALTQTDPTKVTYDRETAYIEVTGKRLVPLYIEVMIFRTVSLSRATDRILVIRRDMGHTAAIEEVLDIIDRKWLSQQSVSYDY
jgi:hypothetical protein